MIRFSSNMCRRLWRTDGWKDEDLMKLRGKCAFIKEPSNSMHSHKEGHQIIRNNSYIYIYIFEKKKKTFSF